MTRILALALAGALLVHGALLLFGGLVIFHPKEQSAKIEEVELIDDAAKEADKKDEKEPEKKTEQAAADDAVAAAAEAPPDLSRLPELESRPEGPALAALSLGELEAALNADGGSASGSLGSSLSLASGGRIGASGEGRSGVELDPSLSMGELDQRPRALFQTPPTYPFELRKRKVTGSVQVVFFVDTEGRVNQPKVERSTDPAFDRPALEAVRQWKFEAGTKNGKKVGFRMRVPISFHVS